LIGGNWLTSTGGKPLFPDNESCTFDKFSADYEYIAINGQYKVFYNAFVFYNDFCNLRRQIMSDKSTLRFSKEHFLSILFNHENRSHQFLPFHSAKAAA